MVQFPEKQTDRIFFVLGAIIIVALICFTIMSIWGASGIDTMRDVLLGLIAGLTGGYAIQKGGNNGADS